MVSSWLGSASGPATGTWTITRAPGSELGSWIADGLMPGQPITIQGTGVSGVDGTYMIASAKGSVSDQVITLTNAGGAHLNSYFPALAATPEADAVVLADPDGRWEGDARKALGAKLKATYRDVGEMLRKERPGMALVSLEAALAPPVIDRALEAGCHVFCEKPSCVRAADFARLVRKAQQKHRHLMLAHDS